MWNLKMKMTKKKNKEFDRSLKCLNEWITSWCSDTTVIVLVTCHFNVATITPGGSPAVLNDIIVFAFIISSITNGQNTVVQLLWITLWFVVYTWLIELEGFVRCINGNRDWSNGGKGGNQFFFISFWDIDETTVSGTGIFCSVFTGIICSFVWVGFFCKW